jgi:hypothetical protein
MAQLDKDLQPSKRVFSVDDFRIVHLKQSTPACIFVRANFT